MGKVTYTIKKCITAERRRSNSVGLPVYENTVLRWLASPTFSKNMKSCEETNKQTSASGEQRWWRALSAKNAKPHDQEAGPQQDGLHLHVHVQRELDAEVVGVSEDLLQEAAPLLTDAANGLVAVFAFQLQSNNTGRKHKNARPLVVVGRTRAKKATVAGIKNSKALTSKLTSPQQLQARQGPSSFRHVSLLAPWMENRGRKGCQSCLM